MQTHTTRPDTYFGQSVEPSSTSIHGINKLVLTTPRQDSYIGLVVPITSQRMLPGKTMGDKSASNADTKVSFCTTTVLASVQRR